jgi:hypothetical protein
MRKMANRMEHYHTEVREHRCACGMGHYSIFWVTYRDNYFSEDVKVRSRINCNDCADTHIISGYSLLPKNVAQETVKAREAVTKLCQVMKKYALEHYEDQMIQYVSGIPATHWHRIWKIGSPSIGTFRKKLKSDGIRDTFHRILIGNYETTVERILATLKECDIEDKKLVLWNKELESLIQIKSKAVALENMNLFNGELLKEYQTHIEPQ